MGTNAHKQSQPACSHKSHTCWTFPRRREACPAISCDWDLWKQRTQDAEKIFCFPEKEQGQRAILFITQYWMCYDIFIPLNAKDLTIDLTMLAYNRQNAIKLARANNSELLQALEPDFMNYYAWNLQRLFCHFISLCLFKPLVFCNDIFLLSFEAVLKPSFHICCKPS